MNEAKISEVIRLDKELKSVCNFIDKLSKSKGEWSVEPNLFFCGYRFPMTNYFDHEQIDTITNQMLVILETNKQKIESQIKGL